MTIKKKIHCMLNINYKSDTSKLSFIIMSYNIVKQCFCPSDLRRRNLILQWRNK